MMCNLHLFRKWDREGQRERKKKKKERKGKRKRLYNEPKRNREKCRGIYMKREIGKD